MGKFRGSAQNSAIREKLWSLYMTPLQQIHPLQL